MSELFSLSKEELVDSLIDESRKEDFEMSMTYCGVHEDIEQHVFMAPLVSEIFFELDMQPTVLSKFLDNNSFADSDLLVIHKLDEESFVIHLMVGCITASQAMYTSKSGFILNFVTGDFIDETQYLEFIGNNYRAVGDSDGDATLR